MGVGAWEELLHPKSVFSSTQAQFRPRCGRPRARLAPSHPWMPGAPALEPHLLSPALAHSTGGSAGTPQSPLNTLCLPPTIVMLCVSVQHWDALRDWDKDLGREESPTLSGSATCGYTLSVSLILKMGRPYEPQWLSCSRPCEGGDDGRGNPAPVGPSASGKDRVPALLHPSLAAGGARCLGICQAWPGPARRTGASRVGWSWPSVASSLGGGAWGSSPPQSSPACFLLVGLTLVSPSFGESGPAPRVDPRPCESTVGVSGARQSVAPLGASV